MYSVVQVCVSFTEIYVSIWYTHVSSRTNDEVITIHHHSFYEREGIEDCIIQKMHEVLKFV